MTARRSGERARITEHGSRVVAEYTDTGGARVLREFGMDGGRQVVEWRQCCWQPVGMRLQPLDDSSRAILVPAGETLVSRVRREYYVMRAYQ